MKRTCLHTITIENQCNEAKLNTDEQNSCEFHLVEKLFEKRNLDPKDKQSVKSFVRMKISIIIATVLMITISTACSMQKKIENRYVGKGRELVIRDFGEPTETYNLKNGGQEFLYRKETIIKSTVINQGKPTLDPIVSPAFVRTELYKFTIDSLGNILNTSYKKINR